MNNSTRSNAALVTARDGYSGWADRVGGETVTYADPVDATVNAAYHVDDYDDEGRYFRTPEMERKDCE